MCSLKTVLVISELFTGRNEGVEGGPPPIFIFIFGGRIFFFFDFCFLWGYTPPGPDTGIRSTFGRYASYWNAFLLNIIVNQKSSFLRK